MPILNLSFILNYMRWVLRFIIFFLILFCQECSKSYFRAPLEILFFILDAVQAYVQG
jgi:hypothetical protein